MLLFFVQTSIVSPYYGDLSVHFNIEQLAGEEESESESEDELEDEKKEFLNEIELLSNTLPQKDALFGYVSVSEENYVSTFSPPPELV
jgi:hypothetical protein